MFSVNICLKTCSIPQDLLYYINMDGIDSGIDIMEVAAILKNFSLNLNAYIRKTDSALIWAKLFIVKKILCFFIIAFRTTFIDIQDEIII